MFRRGNRAMMRRQAYTDYFAEPSITTDGLLFWAKADTGVFSDDEAATPATDTSGVRVWQDQSGNANHLKVITATSVPVLDVDGLNGNPALYFDGTDNRMLEFTEVIGLLKPVHVMCVIKQEVAGVWLGRYNSNSSYIYTSGSRVLWTPNTGTGTHIDWNHGGSSTDAMLIGGTHDGTSTIQAWHNGTGSPTGTHTGSFQFNSIGQYENTGNDPSGWLAEVIIYDRVLSSDERQEIEEYLNAKYELY